MAKSPFTMYAVGHVFKKNDPFLTDLDISLKSVHVKAFDVCGSSLYKVSMDPLGLVIGSS